MKRLNVICDLQFGSCGKGLFAGFLATLTGADTVVAAWGTNSGHTYIDAAGEKMVNVAIPNGIVSPNLRRVLIGPGSIINPKLLQSEMERYGLFSGDAQVMIHENAAIVTEEHRQIEAEGAIG